MTCAIDRQRAWQWNGLRRHCCSRIAAWLSVLAAMVGVGSGSIVAKAQTNQPGAVESAWLPSTPLEGPSDTVRTMLLQSDGGVLLGGDFVAINDAARGRIARRLSDGSLDTAFAAGLPGADGTVLAMALQADGRIMIAGAFTQVHGVSRGRIARLHADGTLDAGFMASQAGADDEVRAVHVQSDGKILLGGTFTTVNGTVRRGLARLNSDGSLDSGFFASPLTGLDTTGFVSSITVQADGRVLIGGFFTSVHGVDRGSVARLTTTGSLDSTFLADPLTGTSGLVTSMVVAGDGKVVIGGYFGAVNGQSRSCVARLNSDGSLDSTFLASPLVGPNTGVERVLLQSDGRLIIVGAFSQINAITRLRIARLNADGSVDTGFPGPGQNGADSEVYAAALQSDGRVLVAGRFEHIHDTPRVRTARLLSNGSLDDTWASARVSGANGLVRSAAVLADGRTLLGGDFTTVNGVNRSRLVRLTTSGSVDTTFMSGSNTGPTGPVYAVVPLSDGKVLIGGSFSTIRTTLRGGIARLNSNGSLDTTFLANPLTGTDGTVRAIAVQSDGKVLIGGSFSTVNGTARNRLARLNADGTLDAGFSPGSGPNDAVTCLAIQPDGRILVGGYFDTFNGSSRGRLVRLQSSGSLDTSFVPSPQTGVNSFVEALALLPDGRMLIGGYFTAVSSTSRSFVARLNADGTADTTFSGPPPAGPNSFVFGLTPQSDGRIVIVGNFTQVGGVARRGIARLMADGSLDASYMPAGLDGASSPPRAVTLQTDGSAVIAGEFDVVHGVVKHRGARLLAAAVVATPTPTPSATTVATATPTASPTAPPLQLLSAASVVSHPGHGSLPLTLATSTTPLPVSYSSSVEPRLLVSGTVQIDLTFNTPPQAPGPPDEYVLVFGGSLQSVSVVGNILRLTVGSLTDAAVLRTQVNGLIGQSDLVRVDVRLLRGDADRSGRITLTDLAAAKSAWISGQGVPVNPAADLDADGSLGPADLDIARPRMGLSVGW